MTPGMRWAHATVLSVARFVAALTLAAAAQAWYRSAGGTGDWPWWLVIVTAVVIAIALRLLREPIRSLADHIVFGRRAGGYELMRDLLDRMAQALPIDDVLPRLAQATGAATDSPRAEVRVFLSEHSQTSEVWPPAAERVGSPLTMPVQHAGNAVGEIEIEVPGPDTSPFEPRRLHELLGPAGLALSTVRLTYALRARLADLDALDAELRASRDRLLTTRAVEQRRMQAEVARQVLPALDDGVALLLTAKRYELPAAADEVARALEAIRVIGRGIYPPRLAEIGLAGSLRGWATQVGIAVRVRVDDPESMLRRTEVEAGLYFWAVTALVGLAVANDLSFVADAHDGHVRCITKASLPSAPDDELALALRDRAEAMGGSLHVRVGGAIVRYEAIMPVRPDADTEMAMTAVATGAT